MRTIPDEQDLRWVARALRGLARSGRAAAPLGWLVPGLVLVLTVHYAATIAGAWYAFTDWNGLTTPRFVGLTNFRTIFQDPTARLALANTLELAAAFVVAVNAVGLGFALALHRAVKSRNFLRAAFFAPVIMSPLAVSYVWQFIFAYEGPLNQALSAARLAGLERAWLGDPRAALWTILVVMVWQFAGLTMAFYLAGLQGIPLELDEAAAVDGATTFRRLRTITLPLLAPSVTVSVTFTVILGLRVFDQVVALTGGGPAGASEVLATEVYKQTWVYGHFGFGAAFALVLTLLVAIIALGQLTILRRREVGT